MTGLLARTLVILLRRRRTCFSLFLFLLTLLPAHAQANSIIVRLTLRDTIQPISAGYLRRGLNEAAQAHAALVILELDTPGGLLDETRSMVDAIEHSPVPVAVFIAPTGSRAGSAGFFLLESADIAAMAPGTEAGAAHPILEGAGGHVETLDPVLKLKIENDAAAFLRSYTTRRGRNAEAAEEAVRNSKSYSDTEALNLKLIDVIAPDVAALQTALNGRTITRFDGTRTTLALNGATTLAMPPSTRERFLTSLANPDLAVLLLLFGVLLIYFEFNVPGTVIPGALGLLLVMLGLFGLNLLPIRHAALALVLAGLLLLALEFKVASHGVVAAAGILSLTVGLATLVDGPIAQQRVHISTGITVAIAFGLISFWLARIALAARREKFLLGPQAMIGKLAVARTLLAPSGQVEIRGELWQATLRDTAVSVAPGGSVVVRSAPGLHLFVDAVAKAEE